MQISATPRIAELSAAYLDAKARADEATSYLSQVKDALKAEMLAVAQQIDPTDPLTTTEVVAGPARYTLKQQASWRIDTPRLKAEQPQIYAAYAKQTTSLVLRDALA